ncbi:MAG TPA: hypothetical protein VGG39_21115 [Polyangiaceae bacterium]|jgi:hypothetical protein
MRLTRLLRVLPFLPGLALAAACGGSSNGNGNAASDAGADARGFDASAGQDSGAPVDASSHDSGATLDGGGADTGLVVADGGACPGVNVPGAAATHGNPPNVSNLGGPVLHSPRIVTFTFADTPNAAALQAFGASIASSAWFAQTMGDYTTTSAPPLGLSVALTANGDPTYVDDGDGLFAGDAGADAAASAGTDLNAFINTSIANAVAATTIPAPDGNTVYAFYFPPSSTITGFVGQSCQAYGGYHFNQVYGDGTTPIYYAIIPDCAQGTAYELQAATLAASHEIDEASSDPAPNTGWSLDVTPYPEDAGTSTVEFRNDPWLSLGYGEIGDNCEGTDWTLDGGTLVQRIWSNTSASAGHDPCVPVPSGESYFNASPDKAVYVASVGDTFTIDVTAFTDAPRASWQLDAVDYTQQLEAQAGLTTPYLKLEWVGGVVRSDGIASVTCMNNGMHAQLQVTLLADPAALQAAGLVLTWPQALGAIYSLDLSQQTAAEPGQDTAAYTWPFEVVTPAIAAQIGLGSSGVSDAIKPRKRFWAPVPRFGR